jgi:toxin-antitoxin system PIN domain toxin
MTSLSFPDINVWLAILLADHVHRDLARAWWDADQSGVIAFLRLTQLGVLRLLTTAAAMNNRPLTMPEAWAAHDRLFADGRVAFLDEPPGLETRFRSHSRADSASPKLWADAWLVAFAEEAGGTIVTFDRPLAARAAQSILLA